MNLFKRLRRKDSDSEIDEVDNKKSQSYDIEKLEIKPWDKDNLQECTSTAIWRTQLNAVLNKNYILQKRKWISFIIMTVLTPLIAMICINLLASLLIDSNDQYKDKIHQEKSLLSGIPNCHGNETFPDNCINFMYTNCLEDKECQRDATIDKIVSNFVESNNKRMNLTWETDSNKWDQWKKSNLDEGIKKHHDIIYVPNSNFIYNYTLNYPNVTSYGIIFNISKENDITNYRYQVWFNSTKSTNNNLLSAGTENSKPEIGSPLDSIVRGIDEAIIQYTKGDSNKKTEINISLKDFPNIAENYDVDFFFSLLSKLFFFIVTMVIFINLISNVVSEKENKVRYSMEMMGLKKSVYWISWIIHYSVIIGLNVAATIFFGFAFGYSFFLNTNKIVLVLLFILFGLAMGALGFFISTLLNRTKQAVLLGIIILIFGILIEYIVFYDGSVAYLLWSEKAISYTRAATIFLPFFNFGKAVTDINAKSSNTFNHVTETVEEGKGFKWGDLFENPKTTSFMMQQKDDEKDYMEPPSHSFYYLLLNIAIYMILALYVDNVRPNEYGKRQSFFFFLKPSYWMGKNSYIDTRNWIVETKNRYQSRIKMEDLDDDVYKHSLETCDPNSEDAPIRIINLRKVFTKGKKRKVAVRNSCLTIGKNKVVALLGQNGAGKSTTMNIISGLASPSSGDILVMNKSVRNNPSGVQSELGICPQHDILFDDLTAMEHLRLYAGLKGSYESPELDEILINRLKAVQLFTVKDAFSKTYSGGMKRRLSMVIATIGDPNVILLDEPTTGMDPVNRRYVWRFIEQFKKDRCVLLTTHSMEEADALGDDIVIMSRGIVKAIGSSIHLKNKFGKGYRISILVDEDNMDILKAKVNEMVPGIHLADDSAGALIYDFSYEQSSYIPGFVKYLDENPDGYVNTWGMSQTTLEEVFLNVIHEDSKRRFKEE